MPAYHVSGPSGSGKSRVGRELGSRGFRVIETDSVPGLSAWVNDNTNEKVANLPPHPFAKEWVDTHRWLWDAERLNQLIEGVKTEPAFLSAVLTMKKILLTCSLKILGCMSIRRLWYEDFSRANLPAG